MEKREKASKTISIIFTIFLLWSILQIFSPFMLPSNSIFDLSGNSVIVENNQITLKMYFPINFIYSTGDRICHQQADRSFFLNGNQMPFCSRCTALWTGFTIGLLFLSFFTISLDKNFIFIIIVSLVPLSIDGIGQLFGFWESTNILRLQTGLITGIVFGMAIGVIIDEVESLKKF